MGAWDVSRGHAEQLGKWRKEALELSVNMRKICGEEEHLACYFCLQSTDQGKV